MKLSHVVGHLSGFSWKTTVWGGDPAMEMRKWQNMVRGSADLDLVDFATIWCDDVVILQFRKSTQRG